MSEMNLKNTKAEILDALNAALAREKEAKRMKADPIAQEKTKKESEIVQSTKQAVEQNIFSQELIKKFNDLEAAIEVEEARLTELYGVEKELQSLTVAVNAGKDALEKIEADKNEQSAFMKNEIQALKDEYAQKNEALKAEYEKNAKALKIERDREAEEFSYKLKRARMIENNEWEDSKATREAALAEKEQSASQIMAEAQSKADYLKELEEKVAGIPVLLEQEISKAVKSTTESLNREFDHKIEIAGKDYTNTIAQLEYKVETLSHELNKTSQLSDSLQSKLDKAYADMRELAATTVETSGGIRFINNPAGEKQA